MDKPPDEPEPVSAGSLAVKIFRAVLWFVPTCFAILSLIVVVPVTQSFGFSYMAILVSWLILSAGFALATGWFHASLFTRAQTEAEGIASRMLGFFLLQLIVVPGILVIAWILLLKFGPPLKFYCMIHPPIF